MTEHHPDPVYKGSIAENLYRCILTGKSITETPLVELVVRVHRTRTTKIWVSVEEWLGREAVLSPLIQQHFKQARAQATRVRRTRELQKDSYRASRFADAKPGDAAHDMVDDQSPEGKRTEPKDSMFVEAKTLASRLGIVGEAVGTLVKELEIDVIERGGKKVITYEAFESMAHEVRKRTVAERAEEKKDKYSDQMEAEGVTVPVVEESVEILDDTEEA